MAVSRAVSFLYLIPMLAVLIAWLWLGEVPSQVALAGGAMVIAGVVLVNSGKSKPRAAVEPRSHEDTKSNLSPQPPASVQVLE